MRNILQSSQVNSLISLVLSITHITMILHNLPHMLWRQLLLSSVNDSSLVGSIVESS